MSKPILYWFRQDLRLEDLPGLTAAAKAGPVVPVFVLDDETPESWVYGGASRWWLHHSLAALQSELKAQGGFLAIARGCAAAVIPALAEQIDAQAVYCSRQYQPWSEQEELAIKHSLEGQSRSFKRYPGTVLFEPNSVLSGAGTPFKVFTPFWKACLKQLPNMTPQPIPEISFGEALDGTLQLDELGLLPTKPNWAAGWEKLWQPGSEGAQKALHAFLADGVAHYDGGRDIPSKPYTSRLSPHLKFGEISPRQIWAAAEQRRNENPDLEGQIKKFLSEVGWREFCYQLMAQFPEMPEQSFKSQFDHFPWAGTEAQLTAWQKGQTGYPIVDAGMRELWQTGFMHNRVRMITASFLTKHLLIHWEAGERWFWDCLLDADLAANACSWQWVAGSGADAAPYFRIFNPFGQGEKFDGDGKYVRQWCPELAGLPNKYIHQPWEAPGMVLESAGVKLGENYPHPMVDHKSARESALAAYGEIKGKS